MSVLASPKTEWHITDMSSAVELYEALTTASDDRTRARLIAEAFERLEERYPHSPNLATQGHVRKSELRLQKESEQVRGAIEQVRAEQRQSELRLQKEIEQVRGTIEQARAEQRQSELRLQKEIEQVRAEIAHTKADLLKWIVPLMFAQVAAIAALVKLL